MHQATAGPSAFGTARGNKRRPVQATNAVSSLLTGAACRHRAAPASAQGNTGCYPQGDLGHAVPDLGSGADGAVTRLRDVARLELGAADYSLRSLLNND